jgi:hypothetical protein
MVGMIGSPQMMCWMIGLALAWIQRNRLCCGAAGLGAIGWVLGWKLELSTREHAGCLAGTKRTQPIGAWLEAGCGGAGGSLRCGLSHFALRSVTATRRQHGNMTRRREVLGLFSPCILHHLCCHPLCCHHLRCFGLHPASPAQGFAESCG